MRRMLVALAALAATTVVPAGAVPPLVGGALASPNVDLLATIPDAAAIGGRILGNHLYVTTVQGVRIYDISLAGGIPVLIGALELPHFENEDVDTNGRILLVSHDGDFQLFGPDILYVVDVSIPQVPLLVGVLPSLPGQSAGHTVSCINDCSYAWLGGDSEVFVVDLRTPSNPHIVGSFESPGGYVHDVQTDEAGISWLATGDGAFGYTTADPLNPVLFAGGAIQTYGTSHNSLRPNASQWNATAAADGDVDPGELVVQTSEAWLALGNGAGCRSDGPFSTGWVRRVGSTTTVEPLDSWRVGQGTLPDARPQPVVACSSHYFSERAGVVAVGWYEQGVRFLSVADPTTIRQVGYYMPLETETWNVVYNPAADVFYTLDVGRGIDVLKFNGSAASPTVFAPRLNPQAMFAAPSERWGWACRVIA